MSPKAAFSRAAASAAASAANSSVAGVACDETWLSFSFVGLAMVWESGSDVLDMVMAYDLKWNWISLGYHRKERTRMRGAWTLNPLPLNRRRKKGGSCRPFALFKHYGTYCKAAEIARSEER